MATSQSEIFARYRSLSTSSMIQPTENATSKKIDNLSFIDFLFEIIKATKGQNAFKNVVLRGVLTDVKKKKEINDIIKNTILSLFGCDSNLRIPGKLTTSSVNGIPMTKSEIDSFGLLKYDPQTSTGKLMYEGNDIRRDINFFIYKSQFTDSKTPLVFTYKGTDLFSLYAINSNTFMFKFGSYYKNRLYSDWLQDYLEACDPTFNFTNFTTILTDIITGAISFNLGKNKLDIGENSAIIKALQKIFGFCNESDTDNQDSNGSIYSYLSNQNGNAVNNSANNNNNSNTNLNDSANANNYFDFTQSELNEIDDDANSKAKSFVKFSTCGDLEIPINSTDIIDQLNTIFDNSDNDNIIDYSNNGDIFDPSNGTTIKQDVNTSTSTNTTNYDNKNKNPNVDKTLDFLLSFMNPGLQSLIALGESTLANDFNNINAANQLNILKAIPYAIMQMILSPKILIISKTHAYLNGDETTKDTRTMINQLSKLILKIGDRITRKILSNIFDTIKSDLLKIAKNLAGQYLKQRGLDYLATLRSLLSLLNLLNSLISDSGCESILGKLLKLLKLANFGPMPILPPPIIYFGGALKPGLNQVSMVNDIKASLQSKGIETAPTMPDGTPNNMMIAIEETVKTMITHIKTNANIQICGMGATGPVQGFGQMQ